MLNKHEKYTQELKDPLLSALLREALEDDPALMNAPGRTDRIMRKVLASGVQSAPRGFRWQPFAWASGSLATAALAVVMALGFFRLPETTRQAQGGAGNTTTAIAVAPTDDVTASMTMAQPKDTPSQSGAHDVPDVREKPVIPWTKTKTAVRAIEKQPPLTTANPVGPDETNDSDTPTTVVATTTHTADALYTAGAVAATVGDYETAYTAYNASYELAPTPDALLASGRALEQLANETLNSDESSS